MKARTLRIRHALFLCAFFFGIVGVSWGQSMWVVHLTYGRPIALTGGDRYVGDQVNQGSTYYYQFELNQSSWNASEVGIGKNTDGTTGWSWASATWYQDGSFPNKRVQRDIGSFQFTSSGTYYVVGRAKTNAGDPWVYSEESSWNNDQTLTLSTSTGNASYITVSDLQAPTLNSTTSVATSPTTGSVTLNWTKFASKNVMIVQSASNSFTSPTDGSNYSVGNNIGSGSVVYNGSGNSITISNLDIGTTYYFALYTENYTYYSTAVTTSKTVPSTTGDGNWSSAATWGSNSVPTSASNIFIGHAITQDQALVEASNLSVLNGAALTVAASKQLTVSGTLTNNGTFTLESGATFKQGSSIAGGGTYNVKQTIDNGAGSGSTLTGRYWYLGTPLSCSRSSAFGASGSLNKVWRFNNGAYSNVADTSLLSPTIGYVHRRSDASSTLTFSGQNLYATDVTLSLSNNAGTYAGWHLIANPYTAYLDWSQVCANSSNISPTYYIRSFNSNSQDVNALITYNNSNGLEANTSSYNLGSTYSNPTPGSTIAQYIAPMQAIWVKVLGSTSTVGSLTLNRNYTSHQTGNVGLKNSTVFPTLARVNLVDGARFDQMLVFMNQDMSNAVDQYDSEKMFVSGAPQIYTMAAGKKLVMNGLKNNKKKISVPLYLELPESKVYNLQLAEYILEDGLILLEDKQEGIIQDFTINDVYAFYANSGVLSNRFVLHFFAPDNGITAQGPSNSWVEDETSYTEGGQIVISADGKGKVQITLDQPDADNNQATIQAVDANGRVVYSGLLEGITIEIQLDVPSGVYYLTVQSGNLIEKKKVFIQE